jgi:hypothetical protein
MTTYRGSKPGYATRTVQGLFDDDGGFAQPATIKRIMSEGVKLELYTPGLSEFGDWWEIDSLKINPPHINDNVTFYCGEYGVEAKYTDAVKVRVIKEE